MKEVHCPSCGKDVKPIKKPFGVLLCKYCSKILDGGKYSMDKAAR